MSTDEKISKDLIQDSDISAELRTVVTRQYVEIQQTHDIVRDLRDAYANA